MLPPNLGQGVADGVQEIVVGVEDDAVEAEFDYRLGFADRIDLAAEILQQAFEILGVFFDGGCGRHWVSFWVSAGVGGGDSLRGKIEVRRRGWRGQ